MPVEQLRSLQRHERILDAATRVFATKGYHGTLVDEIASEAETSKGGVYFHFPNKQAIFLALFDRLSTMLREHTIRPDQVRLQWNARLWAAASTDCRPPWSSAALTPSPIDMPWHHTPRVERRLVR